MPFAGTLRFPETGTFCYQYDGDGEITVSISNPSVATVTVNKATKTITVTSINVDQTAVITVSAAEGKNYLATATPYGENPNSLPETSKTFALTVTNTYTVTYHANDGSDAKFEQQVSYGSVWTTSSGTGACNKSIFDKPGYSLKGWTTGTKEDEGTSYGLGQEQPAWNSNTDLDLNAVWTENSFIVTIPTTIVYENMPVGTVSTSDTFDITVQGEYPGTVTVKAAGDTDLSGGRGTIHASAESTGNARVFTAAEDGTEKKQQDTIKMSGEVQSAGLYQGQISYIVTHDMPQGN